MWVVVKKVGFGFGDILLDWKGGEGGGRGVRLILRSS